MRKKKPPTWPYESFNDHLETLMKSAGISSRAELSRETGIGETQFSNYRKGSSRPTRETLRPIAAVLNVPLVHLEIKAGLIDSSELDIPEPRFEVYPRPLTRLYEYFKDCDESSQEWILRKVEDLNEQIQMRIDLAELPRKVQRNHK